jgi:hypothetical protein
MRGMIWLRDLNKETQAIDKRIVVSSLETTSLRHSIKSCWRHA